MRPARSAAVLAALLCSCAAGSQAAPAPAPAGEVRAGGRLAARYVHATYDAAQHVATCKVWHEVFAPDGRLLTKGKGGRYEHHRGLFFGHDRVRCAARTFDFWHCGDGASQRHAGFAAPVELGLAGDWQVAAIDWCDATGAAIVRELRALRAAAPAPDVTRLDVVIALRAAGDEPVHLGGDPHHSGHQFRALGAFAEDGAARVRYVCPAGASSGHDDVWTGCDWIAAVLPLPDGPVTVVRVEHEGNPGPVRWSTRDYGRFGATFAHRLRPGEPLRLRYSYVVALGERTPAQCEALATAAR